MSEKTYPMVRLIDKAGEGVWVATEQITAIGLATMGDDGEHAVSKILLNHGIALEIQGTPDEIVQYLAGEPSDDSQPGTGTLDTDENGYPADLQYGSGYDR